MKTTRNLETAPVFGRSTRRGMTLVEIMTAILVLSIGLVGVLSAIPFGGLRLSQMREADNSSALGRNAVRMMKANDWANPNNWWYDASFVNEYSVRANGNLNLKYPFFVDPISKDREAPEFFPMTPADGFASFFTRVAPTAPHSTLNQMTPIGAQQIESAFYLQDDLSYGYSNSEDETYYRPRVETTGALVGDDSGTAPFSGRYTWLATVAPKISSGNIFDCSTGDVVAADYDVVVFENRVPGDEKAFAARLEGSGYQGGTFTLDLLGGRDVNNGALGLLDRRRVVEQLETTRYVLLTGNEDMPTNGDYRAFARWYRIANYGVTGTDADGSPTTLRLTLVGPNAPTRWASQTITATIFPGAIGVYSGSVTF